MTWLAKKDLEPLGVKQWAGFYELKPGTVLFCSIIKDENRWEYFVDCNRNVWYSIDPEESFETFEECYEAMERHIEKNKDFLPNMVGMNINAITEKNMTYWKFLGIEKKYPVGGLILR